MYSYTSNEIARSRAMASDDVAFAMWFFKAVGTVTLPGFN
ncbi:hypothetical protein PALI_a2449 [Pseudoalteromonas aliena SW19]|uniref:Uncharacterized protein n=1 Tax=Pseudoalteromonas aliena SW19 TaxID=1314866 RepID=A0ABR9E1H9_9GAMM|nr:hypothetical protein [Pseudoalteromonas aliena SW19]